MSESELNIDDLSIPCSSTSKKGRIVHGQAREIIANVIHFMKNEADNFRLKNQPLFPLVNFRERIMAATGISAKVYRLISKELELVDSGKLPGFSTPTRKKLKRKNDQLANDNDNTAKKHALRTTKVKECSVKKKTNPTLASDNGILRHSIFDASEEET